VRNPRSHADAVASSCKPMFVGEVRRDDRDGRFLEIVRREPVSPR
jgi:hypothetical protein